MNGKRLCSRGTSGGRRADEPLQRLESSVRQEFPCSEGRTWRSGSYSADRMTSAAQKTVEALRSG
ncbi:hypothetical protein CRUP_001843 [Coryphaenoides rupestris]|nr:hypothetical protein CRUP_001843 [Coryphaenoides rupestris]